MIKRLLVTMLMLLTMGVSALAEQSKEILLATTTSVRDSGLMDYLLPRFERESGYKVNLIAVGTGKALQMGRDGEADLLLVHAKTSEMKFMKEGHGKERRELAHNYFVLVGPESNEKMNSVEEALTAIQKEKLEFVSRGDDSGTNKKEIALWKESNISPEGKWYISSGSGMAATLKIASELNAYTLSDIATYLNLKKDLDLEIKVGEDSKLLNLYSVITIDPAKNQHINAEGAHKLMEWFTSDKTKGIIGEYGKKEFGMPLFIPEK